MAKKIAFEEGESATSTVVMNEEESQFMQKRNQQDGYRGKRKPKVQTSIKEGAVQKRKI
ncbi:MAG: hypothetical protein PHD54_10910 [Desulfuromonadaceae bacterium]|nr:hypothetical protein [Desulfuromonadaceae bacterium]